LQEENDSAKDLDYKQKYKIYKRKTLNEILPSFAIHDNGSFQKKVDNLQ